MCECLCIHIHIHKCRYYLPRFEMAGGAASARQEYLLAVMDTDPHADAHAFGAAEAASTAGVSADATSVATRIAAFGEDGLFASRHWFLCCAPEAHLGLGIASLVFALVTLGFMMVRLQIDEITGQHSRQFHLLRIGTACVLVLTPIFTSGGLHGEQVTHTHTHP